MCQDEENSFSDDVDAVTAAEYRALAAVEPTSGSGTLGPEDAIGG
jgi:hypothetical protein